LKLEICPLIVTLPVPLIRSVRPVPATADRKNTPLKCRQRRIVIVNVREAAPETVIGPVKVKALDPPTVNVPCDNETGLAIVRAPPPAEIVPLALALKVPVPRALSFPTMMDVFACPIIDPPEKVFVPSSSIVPAPLKLRTTAFVLEMGPLTTSVPPAS